MIFHPSTFDWLPNLAKLCLTPAMWMPLRARQKARANGQASATAKTAPKRTLVIGGAGYIGSVLTRRLLESGRRVRVLDLLCFGEEPVAGLRGRAGFELVAGDFRDVETIVRSMRDIDEVVHLGAIVGEPACAIDEENTIRTNLDATALITQVARGMGVKRLVFASTCSVYGACDEMVDETSPLRPVSLYATTKIDSEKVVLSGNDRCTATTVLRLGTAFGWSYRPRFDLVVNLLTARCRVEGRIVIFNGEQWRPFVHVRDIARAFQQTLDAPPGDVAGEVFNVGSSRMNHQLRNLASTLSSFSPGLNVVRESNGDVRNYRVSFEKIRDTLGFECETNLAEGVREIDQALQSGLVSDFQSNRYHNHKMAAVTQSSRSSWAPRDVAASI